MTKNSKVLNEFGKVNIKIKPGSESASLQYISEVYKSIFPINAYTYKFMDQQNKLRYAAEAKWKQIILYSAILTVFISCIGLFGLANLSTEKRTKEIEISCISWGIERRRTKQSRHYSHWQSANWWTWIESNAKKGKETYKKFGETVFWGWRFREGRRIEEKSV